VIVLLPVGHVHKVLDCQVQDEDEGDYRAAAAEKEEDGGVDDKPHILVRQTKLVPAAGLGPSSSSLPGGDHLCG